ncbi:NADPH-dependent FMN reductase [Kocuria tytonicola]|uniref:NADPH-dependent FMN reductase n=1 Tax=Kocuria tytonicola TaxID=2055946 RepID=A0A3L9M208_9MICC|nr:CE1759 family FMN reductase [Kocuria tytonicola]RLY93697.1 NADPH-dependent FMN reductase [Kocuria tytonicola]RLZ03598.1 NADPH-dependent FMN reductase [Kocuria tytonicola]
MTDRRSIAVVTAGLSEDASTTRLARAVGQAASDAVVRGGGQEPEVRLVTLRDIAHGITDAMLTGMVPEPVQAAMDAVLTADALVAATPTYKASYSGLFKEFFDLFDEGALENLPTVVAATGGSPRHSLVLDTALRPLMSYLKALTLPIGVYAATEDWADASLQSRIERAGAALAGMLDAGNRGLAASSAPARPAREVRDEFATVPDFADLLASVQR